MDDDFNMPGALAAVFDLASEVNRVTGAVSKGRESLTPAHRQALDRGSAALRGLGSVLGLRLTALVTPAQVAKLRDLAQELSRERPDLFASAHLASILPVAEDRGGDGRGGEGAAQSAGRIIEFIAAGRMRARSQKDWATGDRIRARLADLGVLLEDTPAGFKWRVR